MKVGISHVDIAGEASGGQAQCVGNNRSGGKDGLEDRITKVTET